MRIAPRVYELRSPHAKKYVLLELAFADCINAGFFYFLWLPFGGPLRCLPAFVAFVIRNFTPSRRTFHSDAGIHAAMARAFAFSAVFTPRPAGLGSHS